MSFLLRVAFLVLLCAISLRPPIRARVVRRAGSSLIVHPLLAGRPRVRRPRREDLPAPLPMALLNRA